ncbi:winged helix DNA-binding protein [Actinocorallia herbida]|uniref:Winged helix DNA-binding protein n=1 Tax=Actinocorallia herbida TaxID=58109 RepID=A0A3N1CUR3_9ACTN|nr:winged helix DNA-binding domain-containing protein [Actinocorallia herbida]ROO85051.1 winged helix DNA-binding protein [Actinocorallia herbida]
MDVLTTRALNRALLDRQLLLRRAELPAEAALAHLLGLQSQAVDPPYLGLWTRLEGFAADDLSALLVARKAVRIALMRSTLHLVTAADCLELRALLAESLARTVKGQFGGRLPGVDLAELAAEGARLAGETALTFAELGKLLGRRWPDHDPNALAQTVRNLVPLVQVPPRGLWGRSGPAAHLTAEAWLGRGLDPAPSPDGHVLRYLAAFGPASVKDMQKWSGLTRLKAAFTRLGPRLRRYRAESGEELYDLADLAPPDAEAPAPVRFLPEFDNILLSHADRTRIMPDHHRARVFTVNGIIRASILVDGFVAGLWRVERSGATATLAIEPFGALDAEARTALLEEGARLLAFLAPEAAHDLRILPAG